MKDKQKLTVVLADDESDALERLKSFFVQPPLSDKFIIVGAFINGYDCLEGVEALTPDLLITDVKMPYIDGIEVIKRAKEEQPLLQSIIISGFDDFDFAKRAIDLGVVCYLTKPVCKGDFELALAKAENEIERQMTIDENIINLQNQNEQTLLLIQENDLCRLLNMKELPDNFAEKLVADGISIYKKNMILAIIDFDEEIDDIDFEKTELATFYSCKFANEEFSSAYECHCFSRGDSSIVLLLSDSAMNIEEIEVCFKRLSSKITRLCGASISVGISDLDSNPKARSYRRIFRHANRALNFRNVVGKSSVIPFDDIKNEESRSGKVDENEYKALNYEFDYGRLHVVKDHLKHLVDTISSLDYSENYNFIILNIITSLLKSCSSLNELYGEYKSNAEIVNDALAAKNPDALLANFDSLVDAVAKVNDKTRESGLETSTKKIKDYISLNFADPNLDLENVSKGLSYSISYISLLLRKDGTSFTKYLTDLRMNKAVELLADQSAKIVTVSNAVGYNDPFYFSHCFKKYYGIAPQEYRKK